jgi:hypothetical protein
MKAVSAFVLGCVVFGCGVLAGHFWQGARATSPAIPDDDTRNTLRVLSAQIKDLQEQHALLQKHIHKLESPDEQPNEK